MGNTASIKKAQKEKNLNEVINFIATNYILTQSFEDLESLKNSEYCDKLIIVTSKVLQKYLTTMDVKYLASKMKDYTEVNEMTEDNLLYLKKDKLSDIDVKNATSKKRMCIGIAKYYIKIAYLFSAIVTTINPTYTYKDSFGTTHTVTFKDKNKIPKNVNRDSIRVNKVNLCSERIDALINGQDLSMKEPNQPIKIKPQFCDMNLKKKKTMEEQEVKTKTLADEPGIVQLESLYNDVYDYTTGKFTGMSDTMKADYKQDVELLYKAFSGNTDGPVPSNIKKFSDIPLRNFHNMDGCKAAPKNQYLKEYEGTTKQKLFVDYANHVNEMMVTADKNKNALIGVLDKLFAFAINPQTKKPEITIHPNLKDEELNNIIRETQKLLIALYTSCETDFIKGLEIFEKIIQEQMEITLQNQIKQLKKGVTPVESPDETTSNS
jgi:hypothetical protein